MVVFLVCCKDTIAASGRQVIIFTCFDFPGIWHECESPFLYNTLWIKQFADGCVPSTVPFFFPTKVHPLTLHFITTEFLYSFRVVIYLMAQGLNYSKQQRALDLVFQLFPSMLVQPLSALILNTYFQGKESEGWIRPVGSHRERWGSTLTICSSISTRKRPIMGNRFGVSKDHALLLQKWFQDQHWKLCPISVLKYWL